MRCEPEGMKVTSVAVLIGLLVVLSVVSADAQNRGARELSIGSSTTIDEMDDHSFTLFTLPIGATYTRLKDGGWQVTVPDDYRIYYRDPRGGVKATSRMSVGLSGKDCPCSGGTGECQPSLIISPDGSLKKRCLKNTCTGTCANPTGSNVMFYIGGLERPISMYSGGSCNVVCLSTKPVVDYAFAEDFSVARQFSPIILEIPEVMDQVDRLIVPFKGFTSMKMDVRDGRPEVTLPEDWSLIHVTIDGMIASIPVNEDYFQSRSTSGGITIKSIRKGMVLVTTVQGTRYVRCDCIPRAAGPCTVKKYKYGSSYMFSCQPEGGCSSCDLSSGAGG